MHRLCNDARRTTCHPWFWPVGLVLCLLLSVSCGDGSGGRQTDGGNDGTDGSPPGDSGNTDDGGGTDASGPGPCDTPLRTAIDGRLSDGVNLLAVEGSSTIYAAVLIDTRNTLLAIDVVSGAVRLVYQGAAGAPYWFQSYVAMVAAEGFVYLAGSPGVVRINTATGQLETVISEQVGDLLFAGTRGYLTNTNGEIRTFDLAAGLPATSTLFAKQALEYQNGLLAAGAQKLVILGNQGGGHAIFSLPLAGGNRTVVLPGTSAEYLSGLAADSSHAYFYGTHFSGGTHEGVGRLALDGSSSATIEWLTSSNAIPTIGASFALNRVPLTSDSLIVSVLDSAPGNAQLRRIRKTTLESCVLGTFPTAEAPAVLTGAGPNLFAFYGRDKALHWYVLPPWP